MGTQSKLIDHLNELIQLDYDAVQAYDKAIVKCDDPAARQDLQAFRTDHQRHIHDLGQCIRELGGVPKDVGRDFKGVLLEGLTALRSVTGTEGALKAMRMNEHVTNKAYDAALGEALPPDVRAIVEANRDDERRHLAAIEAHLDRVGRKAGTTDETYRHA